MTYVYPELDRAFELYTWDADRLMRWCARDLHLPEHPIKWYGSPVKAEPGQLWGDVVGTSRFSTATEKRTGWVEWDGEAAIAVVAGQSRVEMLRTVGHEMYHRREMRQGRYPLDHKRAEAYGRRVADDYLARRIP